MSKRKYSEVEMIGALKQMEAGRTAADVGRELGVSKHTIYAWKAKFGRVARPLILNFGCPVLRFLKGGSFVCGILSVVNGKLNQDPPLKTVKDGAP